MRRVDLGTSTIWNLCVCVCVGWLRMFLNAFISSESFVQLKCITEQTHDHARTWNER